jgi:hypothetical protein
VSTKIPADAARPIIPAILSARVSAVSKKYIETPPVIAEPNAT